MSMGLYHRQAMVGARSAFRFGTIGAAIAALALACALLLAYAGGKTTTRAATPPRGVPILLYHQIAAAPHGARNRALYVSPARFRRQVDALARAGYHAVTLGQVWRAWHHDGTLPRKPVVLSFDDGYANQYTAAFPTLRRHGWPGVLNLQLNRVGVAGGLSRARVRALLKARWELGDHTLTHPDLTKVDAARLRAEIVDSKARLEAQFDVAVEFFCYPYGHLDDDVAQAVRDAGFLAATTTVRGRAHAAGDPFRLNRIIASGTATPTALVRLVDRSR